MIIAVTNLKGGVGKTTIATNLAVCLAYRGHQVCVVDTDLDQHSSMEWAGAREDGLVRVPVYGVAEKQLNKEVEDLRKRFDFVVIDGTPHLSELADRTILASDIVLIPLLPSIYDFRGFESFLKRFNQVRNLREASGGKVAAMVVLNRVMANTNISKDIETALGDHDIQLAKTKLINRVSYVDSATTGQGVVEFRDKKAKDEIEALTDEILTILQHFHAE